MCVERDRTAGSRSVGAARECMDHALRPHSAGVGQLEGDATAAFARASSSGDSGAIKIALGIERDALIGLASIRAAGEVIEDCVNAGRGDLEDGSAAVSSTLDGGSVEIAGAVSDELSVGIFAIRAAAETVDQLGCACGPSRRRQ